MSGPGRNLKTIAPWCSVLHAIEQVKEYMTGYPTEIKDPIEGVSCKIFKHEMEV